jgi:hypothetical protein
MNIIEAMKEAREGKKIRRKNWHHTHYIYCNNSNIFFGRFIKEFVFDSKKSYEKYLDAEAQYRKYQDEEEEMIEKATYVNECREVTLRDDHLVADDWEVVE